MAIRRLGGALAVMAAAGLAAPPAAAEDGRELVAMPPMMQAHMLANMRDHLMALEEILGHLGQGDVAAAGRVAEARLGMSSLGAHGAAHMAAQMPEGMAAAGEAMHRAASRFVLVAEDAELDVGPEGQRTVFGALSEIAAACNACHRAWRIR